MTGRKITAQQIRLYMDNQKEGKSKKTAAAKAGFSERSTYIIEKRGYTETRRKRSWKTKKDPFENVWEKELVPLLEREPTLQAITLMEYLQKTYKNSFPDNQLRTLQRRVKQWKAVYGPDKEVIFRQEHPPGWQGLSDFTDTISLGVTIRGEKFKHILYHYRLAFSGWEYAQVILGGESFTALSESLQNALWECGGVPQTHRTDSLSAAYKNLPNKEKEGFTMAYQELCDHYGFEPTRNNKGISHENGTIESSHGHLKRRIRQALMMRGSKDFDSIDEYKQFIREIIRRHNNRLQKSYLEELAVLEPLPERRSMDYTEERVRVTSSSTIHVKRVIYSVPSRLIGTLIKIHLYDDRLECFVGGDLVITLERKRIGKKQIHQINYRHVIGSLIRKPQAFERYIYKDEMFPTLAFRQAWNILRGNFDSRKACREYVEILKEAAVEDRESRVNQYLEKKIGSGKLPVAEEVRQLFYSEAKIPELKYECTDLSSYNELLEGGGSL